jgi:hypothetical protein
MDAPAGRMQQKAQRDRIAEQAIEALQDMLAYIIPERRRQLDSLIAL